jgi:predicted DNA-binding ribbon-helix-helix protein
VGNSEYWITRTATLAPDSATGRSTLSRFMDRELQKSRNAKRSVVIGGHKTSVSLEDAFWKSLIDIAVIRDMPLSDMLATIDNGREYGGLSSAIRVFVLNHYRTQADRLRRPEPQLRDETRPSDDDQRR